MIVGRKIKLRNNIKLKPCPVCKYQVDLNINADERYCRADDGTIIRHVGSISCPCGVSVSMPLEAFDINHQFTWDHIVRMWNKI